MARNKNGEVNKLPKIVRDVLATKMLREIFPNEKCQNKQNLVQARAAISPINSQKCRTEPTLMRYRTLNVGLGSQNDLDLSKYGTCNFVNSGHAIIYFDQYTQIYELINYSEHGTIVDNQVYTLNCRSPMKGLAKSNKAGLAQMSAKSERQGCHCETSAARMIAQNQGCENSAVLRHGSYIRMGCLQFVFSILDYYENPEPKITAKKSKKSS